MPPSTPQNAPIRVIVADDHPVIIDGIRARLATNPRLQIVGVAQRFSDIHTLLATTIADVLILDVTGMHGSPLMTVQRIRREHPSLCNEQRRALFIMIYHAYLRTVTRTVQGLPEVAQRLILDLFATTFQRYTADEATHVAQE